MYKKEISAEEDSVISYTSNTTPRGNHVLNSTIPTSTQTTWTCAFDAQINRDDDHAKKLTPRCFENFALADGFAQVTGSDAVEVVAVSQHPFHKQKRPKNENLQQQASGW